MGNDVVVCVVGIAGGVCCVLAEASWWLLIVMVGWCVVVSQ